MSKLSKLKPNERVPFYTGLPNLSASDFDGDLITLPTLPPIPDISGIMKKCGINPKKNMQYGKKQAQKYLNDQMNIVRSTITEMAIRKTVCIKTFMLANGTQNMSFALPNKQTVSAIVS